MAEPLSLEAVESFIENSISSRIGGPNDVYGIIEKEGGDSSVSDQVPEIKAYDGTADLINVIPFLLTMIQDLKCRVDCIEETLKQGITITIPIPDPPPTTPPPITPIPDPNP